MALAIVAAVLGSIGSVIATTVRGTRAIDQRIALTGVTESLLATLPPRGLLKPGRQTGETAGYRWMIEVAPLNAASRDEPAPAWLPLAINMRLQSPTGAVSRLTTVRLVKAGP